MHERSKYVFQFGNSKSFDVNFGKQYFCCEPLEAIIYTNYFRMRTRAHQLRWVPPLQTLARRLENGLHTGSSEHVFVIKEIFPNPKRVQRFRFQHFICEIYAVRVSFLILLSLFLFVAHISRLWLVLRQRKGAKKVLLQHYKFHW